MCFPQYFWLLQPCLTPNVTLLCSSVYALACSCLTIIHVLISTFWGPSQSEPTLNMSVCYDWIPASKTISCTRSSSWFPQSCFSASLLVVMAWMRGGLAWLQRSPLPSQIDELIAALLPVSLCPRRGRPGYGRESQLWHPPWCRYYERPAGGHWGWQPREQPWPTYCCHAPGDTHCEGRQGGVWDLPQNKGVRYWASC